MTPAGEADWGKLNLWKKLRHRLSETAVASQFSWPRTWCAGWFGQIDFQTISWIRGSTTDDYKDERRSGVWSVEQQRNLWVQQLGITLPYLHLSSEVEKNTVDWLIFKSTFSRVNNRENRFSITYLTKPVQMVFRVVQSERRLFWTRRFPTCAPISSLPFLLPLLWWNELELLIPG